MALHSYSAKGASMRPQDHTAHIGQSNQGLIKSLKILKTLIKWCYNHSDFTQTLPIDFLTRLTFTHTTLYIS